MEGDLSYALPSFDAKSHGLEYLSLEEQEEAEQLRGRGQGGRTHDNSRAKADDLEILPAYHCLRELAGGGGRGECPLVEKASAGSSGEAAQLAGYRYSRDLLLHTGLALFHCQPVPEDRVRIGLSGREETLEVVVFKLVELAGGKVKIANLAAAALALGVVKGRPRKAFVRYLGPRKDGFQGQVLHVCQEILAAVHGRQDLFGPLPEAVEVGQLTVSLRG